MPSADDLTTAELTKGIMILLKSPPGFGKTIAACSMAVDGPTWLAYWDKSKPIELLYYKLINRPELLKNITYNTYSSNNANEFLNKLIEESKRPSYKNIVVDSVTMMTASAVNWSMGFRDVKGGAKRDDKNPNSVQLIPDFDEYKVETSLVTQSLDLCRGLAEKHGVNIIWTCHPVPSLKVEGSGRTMSITKVNNIVSYGSKVAGIVPGQFPEIYHLGKENEWDGKQGKSISKRFVFTRDIGEDFTKTVLNLPEKFEITGKLFWEAWKEQVKLANPQEVK